MLIVFAIRVLGQDPFVDSSILSINVLLLKEETTLVVFHLFVHSLLLFFYSKILPETINPFQS